MKLENIMLTRRQALIAGLGSVATLGLAACGGSSTTTAATTTAAETDAAANPDELTTFIVGFDQEYPPYGFRGDDGEFTGFDLELAAEVCSRQGWEFQAEPIDWDTKDTLINSNGITCIWNGFTMEGREDSYSFSEPYMLNGQVVVVKADSGITDFAGLAGKTVITQVDSAALEVLEGDKADVAATFATLDQIGDYNTAFMSLESGAVDAVACDLSIFEYQNAANPGVYVKLDEALSTENYAVGFKKGNDELAATVTETLKAMDDDGFVKELCEKYAEYGISYENWEL